MTRVDTHTHLITSSYRKVLQRAGIDHADGLPLPDWSPEAALPRLASNERRSS